MITVHMHHIRSAKLCSAGARQWFDKHDLSWTDFLHDGLPVEVVEATGCAIALRVTAIAREEASNGR